MARWAVIVGAALLMAACTPEAPRSTPPPSPVFSSQAQPGDSPTPAVEELQRQAGEAYQQAFDEYERLSRAGGAEQPTQKMLDVEQDRYLEQDLALLRKQKQLKATVEGEQARTKFRVARGTNKNGSDPRLTLQVCEDRRASTSVVDGQKRIQDRLSQGFVYARVIQGRVKLVDVDTTEVTGCAW